MDGSYRAIDIGSDRFTDLDGNTPIVVVNDTFSFEGDFPGTVLYYKNGIFYSPDFNATEAGSFTINLSI